MHELPITKSVLDMALQHAEAAGGGRITNLYLEVGQLSGVVNESVQFYWDIISEDTAAEGAKLHFTHIPLKMECLDCGASFEPEELTFQCTSCESLQVRVTGGEEFRLMAIDVDQEEHAPAESGS
jgi:hydrogenase nickel incorporation protein HypA/HybF